MRSVGNCSVVSAWRNMGGEDLVHTAGEKTHSTLETVRVSYPVSYCWHQLLACSTFSLPFFIHL